MQNLFTVLLRACFTYVVWNYSEKKKSSFWLPFLQLLIPASNCKILVSSEYHSLAFQESIWTYTVGSHNYMAPFIPVWLLGRFVGVLVCYSYIAISLSWNGDGITRMNASYLLYEENCIWMFYQYNYFGKIKLPNYNERKPWRGPKLTS